jgi:two-component system nitrogen regulation response regulator NtrX
MEPAKILVVDDDKDIRISLQEILQEEGHDVLVAENLLKANEAAASGTLDLALVDIKIGSENGLDLLRRFKNDWPRMPVIIISGQGTVALTAEAFKLGAHDFMEKPLRLIQVRTCVRNALEAVRLRTRAQQEARQAGPQPIYNSEPMKQLYHQIDKLANISEPVVIVGPSGSGKELVARALHYNGARGHGPFIATNAASMPVTLAEDELFGHEKGAFTGAHAARTGCIEQADGGTLFLDEIADMDMRIQAKLLRVLESGTFTRLGGTRQVSVAVRIIAATHKDLEFLVKSGAFRHDLWFRLCAFILRVPSLAERKDDISPLAQSFLKSTCKDMTLNRSFTDGALKRLRHHDYPGNVRELRHIVTRAAVFADTESIDESTIEIAMGGRNASAAKPAGPADSEYATLDARAAREKFERDYFSAVLARNNGNITAAAAAIGMAQSNLSRKLKELGLR